MAQVVFPVFLFTVVFDVLHGMTAPVTLVTVQVAVPVGSPAPGAAAVTKAVKLAAFEVTVGLSFGVMATWVGDLPIVSVKFPRRRTRS